MITEDYVSFETAKLLKEKGFKEPCIATYNLATKTFKVEEIYQNWTKRWKAYVSAPTLQMTMKWLREVHKINIEICLGFDADSELGYFYNPVISNLKNMALAIETPEFDETEFIVYEEAAEAAIMYCLKNLI